MRIRMVERARSLPEVLRPLLATVAGVRDRIRAHRAPVVAGGVAFFLLLSLVPAMIAAVSIFGLVVPPSEVTSTLEPVTTSLPTDAGNLVDEQLQRVASSGGAGLSVGAALALVVALWTTSSGVKALIGAVNLAHEQRDRRGFLALRGLSVVLALAAIAGLGAFVLLQVVSAELGGGFRRAYGFLQFPLIALGAFAWLAVLYRFAPHERDREGWHLVSGDAIAAVVLAGLATFGLGFYVSNFGSYNETYGTLGAVILLMTWLFVVAFAVVIGAELDAELDDRPVEGSSSGDGRRELASAEESKHELGTDRVHDRRASKHEEQQRWPTNDTAR